MMQDKDLPVTEDELHAYVDGELPVDRRAAVEAWLATHADDAARVAAWRRQAEAIRARYGEVAEQPIPHKLHLGRMSYASRSWKIAAAAAVFVAFFLGGLAGWILRESPVELPDDLARLTAQALYAHKIYTAEVRHPVEVVAAEAAHLQQWLSKRVGAPLRAPNLEKQGLQLVGGRLLPTSTGKAAAFFMYENASGERFTLYCARTEIADSAMRYNEAEKAGTVYWVDSNVAYIVSGANGRKQLWHVARAAYEQIEPREARRGS
jgi:anti-sigma factor RsiW